MDKGSREDRTLRKTVGQHPVAHEGETRYKSRVLRLVSDSLRKLERAGACNEQSRSRRRTEYPYAWKFSIVRQDPWRPRGGTGREVWGGGGPKSCENGSIPARSMYILIACWGYKYSYNSVSSLPHAAAGLTFRIVPSAREAEAGLAPHRKEYSAQIRSIRSGAVMNHAGWWARNAGKRTSSVQGHRCRSASNNTREN